MADSQQGHKALVPQPQKMNSSTRMSLETCSQFGDTGWTWQRDAHPTDCELSDGCCCGLPKEITSHSTGNEYNPTEGCNAQEVRGGEGSGPDVFYLWKITTSNRARLQRARVLGSGDSLFPRHPRLWSDDDPGVGMRDCLFSVQKSRYKRLSL